ncbi:MAG: CotH kinase family protein [Lachnospiraceae bacterium]|nr:CotH kinase family protein [Lachnospiraceae bacterium]
MKKLQWAVLGLLCVLGTIYWLLGAYPKWGAAAAADVNEPTVILVNEILAVGEPIEVVEVGYPVGVEFTYDWAINGEKINNETAAYVPKEKDLQNFISVTVTPDHVEYPAQEITVFFSDLPVFYLMTDEGEDVESKTEYKSGTLKVQGTKKYSDPKVLYNGRMQIKGRGNSTWNNADKDPYHLKLEEDAGLLALGEEDDWTLLSNPFDGSLMRNATAYALSGKMGMAYLETSYIDVVLNGEYVGNYLLCEKLEIAEERVDITDWEKIAVEAAKVMVEAGVVAEEKLELLKVQLKTDLSWLSTRQFAFEGSTYEVPYYIEIPQRTGGALLELDMYYDEISKFRVQNQHFMFNEPKYAASNPELFSYMEEYVSTFYYAAYPDFSEDYLYEKDGVTYHYSDLFDIDSLAAFYLLQEIYFNEDATAMSTFFYKDVEGVAYMGPIWDMDRGSGGLGKYSYHYDQWQTEFYSNYDQVDQWYKGLAADPYFLSRAKKCWDTYHDEIFSLVEDGGMIDQLYAYICHSGRADNELWEWENSFDIEVIVFKNWMKARLKWMEEQYTTLETLVDSIGRFDYGLSTELTCVDGEVRISCDYDGGAYAVLYANGRILGTEAMENGMACFPLADGVFVEESDVIQVRVYDVHGREVASNYMDRRIENLLP